MTIAHQAEFARLLGVDRSHVTRLKQEGRLVMTPEGKVDVEASRQRILETAGGRDDVAARWAKARSAEPPVAPPEQPEMPSGGREDIEAVQTTRADAIARKEHYLALQAQLDYEKAIRAVVPRPDVEAALDDLVAGVRAGVENLPHRVAALLVGKDLDTIRALLKQEIGQIMAEMHAGARRRLAELTQEPA